MRKKLSLVLVLLFIVGLIVGCGQQAEEQKEIIVGATPVPHAKILNEVVKPKLAEEGIDLQVKEFTDYVTPNLALSDGSIDANYFQHIPYLNSFKEDKGLDLTYTAKVHLEPMGLYSKEVASLDEFESGATIAIPNDSTNEGRALLLLANNGLIKLKDDAGLEATPVDIVDNPKNLEFKELEAAQLPRVLKDVTAAVINTNYALEADLVPTEDALVIEGSDSPYANVLAVRTEDKNDPLIQKLNQALTSQEVKEYIQEEYQGGIVATFE